jgi:riboflavin kinase
MRVKGIVFSGVLRGQSLINIHFHRLVGLIGFEPFEGTLDVKLRTDIDIKRYATKSVEHIIMDGTKVVNAYLAPVNLIIKTEKEEVVYPCWAMQQPEGIYSSDIVEIIAKDRLKEKFHLEDGNMVEIELFEKPVSKKEKEKKLRHETQLMRR